MNMQSGPQRQTCSAQWPRVHTKLLQESFDVLSRIQELGHLCDLHQQKAPLERLHGKCAAEA